MKYHTLFFFRKIGKMSQNLSSAAVVIGALKVKNTIHPVSAGQGKRSFFCGSFVCFVCLVFLMLSRLVIAAL